MDAKQIETLRKEIDTLDELIDRAKADLSQSKQLVKEMRETLAQAEASGPDAA